MTSATKEQVKGKVLEGDGTSDGVSMPPKYIGNSIEAEQLFAELLGAVPVQNSLDERLTGAKAVVGKDGKPDTGATIEKLIGEAYQVVGDNIVSAKNDYTFQPSSDQVRNIFRTVKEGIKDGKYTSRIRGALVSLYERTVQESSINKAIARVQAAPLGLSKRIAIGLANMASEKQLIELIKEADSTAMVASYARGALETLYTKAKSYFQSEGDIKKISQAYTPAFAGAKPR